MTNFGNPQQSVRIGYGRWQGHYGFPAEFQGLAAATRPRPITGGSTSEGGVAATVSRTGGVQRSLPPPPPPVRLPLPGAHATAPLLVPGARCPCPRPRD